jgi:hypothetical protein
LTAGVGIATTAAIAEMKLHIRIARKGFTPMSIPFAKSNRSPGTVQRE